MLMRREQTATVDERPFNNLLRRLNDADFGLLAPHLASSETNAGDLLYSPGDHVEIVHFPCGPSLVSYLVPNEDGRDVETILVGREGAVGGIVSQGFLPAYTRITVKFGGPLVRLKWIISAMERTNGDGVVPLTHDQLATLLGVGRSYTSRVIQAFKAEGVLETRRGSILIRNPDGLRVRSCLCNEAVKNHFEEVLRGVYPSEETGSA